MVSFMESIKVTYDLAEEAQIIKEFTEPDDPYGGAVKVFETHSNLESALKKAHGKSENIYLEIINNFLTKYYSNKEILRQRTEFEKSIKSIWSQEEQDLLNILCSIFQVNKKEKPLATAFICSVDIYPRDLDNKTFFIGFRQKLYEAMTTIIHEYTHFLYFDRWGILFPNDMPQASWGPGTLWKLSEIIAVIINQDERILQILPEAGNQDLYYGGESYYSLPMPDGSNNSVLGYFKKLYLEHKYKRNSIDNFLTKCREEALRLEL